MIISGIVALIAILTFAAKFSGSTGGKVYKSPIGMFLHAFDRGVEGVTSVFGAIVDKIIVLRLLTLVVIGVFRLRHCFCEHDAAIGFHSA